MRAEEKKESLVTSMSHKTSLSLDITTAKLFSVQLYRQQVAADAITHNYKFGGCMRTSQNIMQMSQNIK